MSRRITMNEATSNELLYLKSVIGRRFLKEQNGYIGSNEDFYSAREDLIERGLVEADFDGMLHPCGNFGRLLFDCERIQAIMAIYEESKVMYLLNTPLYAILLQNVGLETKWCYYEFREVLPIVERARVGGAKKVQIYTLKDIQEYVVCGSEPLTFEQLAICRNAFFTGEIKRG